MFVGIARLTLAIPAASSLKDKRQVVRKILDRTRARFNVAAAEVADNDVWQRAVLGFAVVGNDRAFARDSLDAVLRSIEALYLAPELHREVELVPLGDGQALRTLADAEDDASHVPFEDDP